MDCAIYRLPLRSICKGKGKGGGKGEGERRKEEQASPYGSQYSIPKSGIIRQSLQRMSVPTCSAKMVC